MDKKLGKKRTNKKTKTKIEQNAEKSNKKDYRDSIALSCCSTKSIKNDAIQFFLNDLNILSLTLILSSSKLIAKKQIR